MTAPLQESQGRQPPATAETRRKPGSRRADRAPSSSSSSRPSHHHTRAPWQSPLLATPSRPSVRFGSLELDEIGISDFYMESMAVVWSLAATERAQQAAAIHHHLMMRQVGLPTAPNPGGWEPSAYGPSPYRQPTVLSRALPIHPSGSPVLMAPCCAVNTPPQTSTPRRGIGRSSSQHPKVVVPVQGAMMPATGPSLSQTMLQTSEPYHPMSSTGEVEVPDAAITTPAGATKRTAKRGGRDGPSGRFQDQNADPSHFQGLDEPSERPPSNRIPDISRVLAPSPVGQTNSLVKPDEATPTPQCTRPSPEEPSRPVQTKSVDTTAPSRSAEEEEPPVVDQAPVPQAKPQRRRRGAPPQSSESHATGDHDAVDQSNKAESPSEDTRVAALVARIDALTERLSAAEKASRELKSEQLKQQNDLRIFSDGLRDLALKHKMTRPQPHQGPIQKDVPDSLKQRESLGHQQVHQGQQEGSRKEEEEGKPQPRQITLQQDDCEESMEEREALRRGLLSGPVSGAPVPLDEEQLFLDRHRFGQSGSWADAEEEEEEAEQEEGCATDNKKDTSEETKKQGAQAAAAEDGPPSLLGAWAAAAAAAGGTTSAAGAMRSGRTGRCRSPFRRPGPPLPRLRPFSTSSSSSRKTPPYPPLHDASSTSSRRSSSGL